MPTKKTKEEVVEEAPVEVGQVCTGCGKDAQVGRAMGAVKVTVDGEDYFYCPRCAKKVDGREV